MESTTGLIDAPPAPRQPHVRRAVLVRSGPRQVHRRDTTSRPGVSSELEQLWNSHGRAAYTLALALLGNEETAAEAVRRAMLDLTRPLDGLPTERAWSTLARDVYRRALALDTGTRTTTHLPPTMAWVNRMARLQRAAVALCTYGRLTHREAAALLDVTPGTVAELLTAGLRELRGLASG
jgi:DNA-directed RNA polymerase specialized sigma24 family protein